MAQRQNITIDQGSDFEASITLFNLDDTPFDLANYTVTGQIRKYTYSNTATVSFSTNVNSNTATGKFNISLDSNTTSTIDEGEYVYDIQISNSNNVYRVVEGYARVSPSVTR